MSLSDEEIAKRSADAMAAHDVASPWLGIERVSVTPGVAIMRLTIAPNHLNGHGICHGGFIFTLADTAFAFACNSRNRATVAQQNQIAFLKPGKLGQVLTATAREITISGRSGIYDVRVTDDAGEIIAEMRGHSRTIGGANFDEAAVTTSESGRTDKDLT